MSKKVFKQADKAAITEWEAYKRNLQRDTAVDLDMTHAEREKRRIYLEAHPLEWIKEMFPNYAKYPFAGFHKRAIKRLIEAPKNCYGVLSWARDLAKSPLVIFFVLSLILTGKKLNILLFSNSLDNAVKLLNLYRMQPKANQRIQFYYGNHQGPK